MVYIHTNNTWRLSWLLKLRGKRIIEHEMGLQLLGLAPELVEGIFQQVNSKKDLCNVRLVCKTLDKFASKELFREVVLSQRKRHLRSWNGIAQSEKLRHIPRHVVIEPRPGESYWGGFEDEEDASGDEENDEGNEDGVDDDEENKDEEMSDGENNNEEKIDEEDNNGEDHDQENSDDEKKNGDEDNSDEESDDGEYGDELKKLCRVIKALSRFSNVDSVEIVFTEGCLGKDARYYEEVEEPANYRERALQMIFMAINNRSSDDRTVRKLTIINLQNYEYIYLVASWDFKFVMHNLEELHVCVVQEYNEHGPDHDFTKVELRTFPAHFCQAWLAPISANLKALTIYQRDQNWGPFPGYFQPDGISFPKLEKLVLQYYTLAHDNDLDWVCSIKSLRKLHLHKCMIASKMRIDTENMTEWNVRTHDWIQTGKSGGWGVNFSYNGKWSTFIDRLHESLPDLREFRFNYGDAFEDRMRTNKRHDARVNKMFSERYITFDNGILPTHWPEAREGSMYQWDENEDWPNLHEKYLEADQASMDRITSRRR